MRICEAAGMGTRGLWYSRWYGRLPPPPTTAASSKRVTEGGSCFIKGGTDKGRVICSMHSVSFTGWEGSSASKVATGKGSCEHGVSSRGGSKGGEMWSAPSDGAGEGSPAHSQQPKWRTRCWVGAHDAHAWGGGALIFQSSIFSSAFFKVLGFFKGPQGWCPSGTRPRHQACSQAGKSRRPWWAAGWRSRSRCGVGGRGWVGCRLGDGGVCVLPHKSPSPSPRL